MDDDKMAPASGRTQPAALRRRAVACMYSKAYFQALGRLPVHRQRERMTLALLEACFPAGSLSQYLQLLAPTLATRTQLQAFHSRDYVDALHEFGGGNSFVEETQLSVAQKKARQQQLSDFELVDDAYVFPGLFDYCSYVAGATLTAVDALLHLMGSQSDTRVLLPPVAINMGGGRHHAMRSQASGFCYVNDVVLGVQRLLTKGNIQRVLCVDIDVHHGDGTQEAFYFSEKVTTVSFHLFERGFFPGTGAATEVGVGRGKHNNINVPLQRGITDTQFHEIFESIVGKAAELVQPEALVLVCGVDTLARDVLGGFNLTSDGICACVESMMALTLPMLLLGAGGYSGADASKCLAAVVATVMGQREALPDRIPEHDFYEEYGCAVRLWDQAIATLESAAAIRSNRNQQGVSQKRKR
ncbi:hypothetical protein BBJ28_00022286 [Nothophytophthora sp. Chile5]|nr:hypothetical protein BBJ28_00022286 [Nothophytophthora sp. Chile5]